MTKILVPSEALSPSASPHEATQSVVDFVNALRRQLWREDEIPKVAWDIYYADFYDSQVRNGGHAQFFFNARPRALVVQHVRDGLDRVGASDQIAVLDRAWALIAENPALMTRLEESGYWGAAAEVAPAFEAVDDALTDIAPESAWTARCRAWLERSDEVERLSRDACQAAIDALRDKVPDRAVREAEAERAWLAAMPPFEREIREACLARGLDYQGRTAGSPTRDGRVVWSFLADDVRREATCRGDALESISWDPPDPFEALRRRPAEMEEPATEHD